MESNTIKMNSIQEIVISDIKGDDKVTPDKIDYLYENPTLWLNELKEIKSNVETQLSGFKLKTLQLRSKFMSTKDFTYDDFLDEKIALESWRVNAIKFKYSVEKKMRVANEVLNETEIFYDEE